MIFLTVTLFAAIDEYKTDIYFGNGVFNTSQQAEISRKKLQDIINKEIIKNDPKLKKKYGEVKLAYNWGEGKMNDVLETYYQLKAAGQVNNLEFFTVVYALTRGTLTLSAEATAALMASMPFYADDEQANVDEMLNQYYEESFSKSHRVLLVSHSQGNLFANRIYDSLTPKGYQDYFANLQVATPAASIHAPMSLYVTLFLDPIATIPNKLAPNVNGGAGHTFVGAYLGQQEPYDKIVQDIKILLPLLDKTSTQWQTKEELNKGTKDYRINVEHRFDPNITLDKDVYPFDPAQKLYQVPDRIGVPHYVKGGYGGDRILSDDDSENISLKRSHRVLLVAHSQGNLFGNEIYDNLKNWEKDYFKMVSIATPADRVLEAKAPYTTLKCDKVIEENLIGGIPGHLSAETNCTGEEQSSDGHQFVANYLSNHLSLKEITNNIQNEITLLSKTPTQWQTKEEWNVPHKLDNY